MVSTDSSWFYAFSNNKLVAYYVLADAVDRLFADLNLLRDRVESGEWQREECVAQLSRLLTECTPKPPRTVQADQATVGDDQPVLVSAQ